MQISCPSCDIKVDLGQIQASQSAISCPNCNTKVDLTTWVSGEGNLTGFAETRTLEYVSDALESGQIVGKFEIIKEVGRGGFGSVYSARDLKLDRVVALKVPRTGGERVIDPMVFLREAQMAAAVRDANIVAVHEIGHEGDLAYICTDFIDGATLKAHFREQKLDVRATVELVIRIARSLQKAHDLGVVHRDLKPANILIDTEGTPFISDFGLAKRVEPDAAGDQASSRRHGDIVGTPAYMSPEQALGDSDVDHRTDIYSLGVVLYELLSGARPFHGSVATLIQSVVHDPPPDLRSRNPNVPKPLEAVVAKAMAKYAEERFQSMAEFADDLQRFLNGVPTLSSPLKGTEKLVYSLRTYRVPILAGLLVMIAGSVAWGISAWINRGNPVVIEKEREIPTARVRINSVPARANVAIIPIDPQLRILLVNEVIQPEGLTPVEIDLPAGEYLFEFFIPGLGAQEVYRTVTPDKTETDEIFEIKPATLPMVDLADLVLVKGDQIPVSDYPDGETFKDHRVHDFYMQPHEVTCAEFEQVMGGLPGALQRDPSAAKPDFPVTRFDYFDAVAYAEKKGMRLPDYYEFYFAATNGGTTQVPWGQADLKNDCWNIAPVKSYAIDKTAESFAARPIFGLFSNVPEVTASTIIPGALIRIAQEQNDLSLVNEMSNSVVVTGAPNLVGEPFLKAQYFESVSRSLLWRHPEPIGFRCVKCMTPRFINLRKEKSLDGTQKN